MSFATRLMEAREGMGLSIDQLSWKAEMKVHNLRRWEGGVKPQLDDNLADLCTALETTPGWLLVGRKDFDYPLLPSESLQPDPLLAGATT